jgi:ribulose-phosphate 3-epimerase
MKLLPAILADNKKEVADQLERVKGLVNQVQIDVIDGEFVDNKTISLSSLAEIKQVNNFKLDLHLMVVEPMHYLSKLNALNVVNYVAQIETIDNQQQFVKQVSASGLQPGLAVDLQTPVARVEGDILNQICQILLLGVKAGYSKQEFSNRVLTKISHFKYLKKMNKYDYEISVDGGIDLEKAKNCFEYGADSVAVGSTLWMSKNIAQLLEKFSKI